MSYITKSRLLTLLKVFIPLGIGIFLLWHFYQSMDVNTKLIFYKAIQEANYFWIGFSVLLGLLSHAIRAYRWKYVLEPLGYHTKFKHRFYAVMSGYLINLLIPRAGEASRAALLYNSDGVPFSKGVGTIISERIVDTIMLAFFLLLTLYVGFQDLIHVKDIIIHNHNEAEASETNQLILIILLGIIAIGILVFSILWIKSDTFRSKLKKFIADLIFGVLSIFKTKKPFHFILQSLSIWILYLLYFAVCFYAFEETQQIPTQGILIGFIAGTLGITFTNGGVGAYPYLVGIVVSYYIGAQLDSTEQAEGIGKALGLIIWVAQTFMMIVIGLISLVLIPKKFKIKNNGQMGTNTK